MLIGVMGDTHHDQRFIHRAMEHLIDMDLIIHTGDYYRDMEEIINKYGIKAIGVGGNCDQEGEAEIIKEINGRRFLICHGHQYSVKSNLNIVFYRGREFEADVVIFGHSHHPVFVQEENMILLNPGSVSEPRGGSKRSIAIIDLQEEIKVKFIELE